MCYLATGAEPFLYSLLSRLEWDLAMSTSSLQCLKLDSALRKSVADILVPTSKIKAGVAKHATCPYSHIPLGNAIRDTYSAGSRHHTSKT